MGVCAYTIVSRAYVPHARVLARTFIEQHPDGEFWTLLIDDIDREIDESREPFRVLRPGHLDMEPAEFHRMAMLFGNRIIAAIKPWIFEHLLRRGSDAVIYIDSDFMIFDSLAEVTRQAAEHGVVVVPHVVTPVPRDGLLPDETTILGVGTFNAGFFAVGPDGGSFLEFLKERLRRECHTSIPDMRVNEQRWLDFVPSLFSHHVLRDPGIDAAPWNIHERPLTLVHDRFMIGEVPLRAFHFSGFDPRLPHVMSARDYWDRPRVPMDEWPALVQLYAGYSSELFAAGFERHHRIPFAFDALADKRLIRSSLRTLYAEHLRESEATGRSGPPDPFDARQSEAFRAWAMKAYSDAGENAPMGLEAPVAGVLTAEDWAGRMRVGEVGTRSKAGVVHVGRGSSGVALSGPGATLDSGRYRARVELDVGQGTGPQPADAEVVLVEVVMDGYVLECASTSHLGRGAVEVDFDIPAHRQQLALSAGVDVFVHYRSGVGGSIEAVLVERLGASTTVSGQPGPKDWLAALSVGDVGGRSDTAIVKRPGRRGFMAEGPRWRLAAGRYQAALALRATGMLEGDTATVVGLVDVVIHGYVVGFQPVTIHDLNAGTTIVEFEVGGRWTEERYTRVEVRVRAEEQVDAVLTSVSVRPIEGGSPSIPAGDDWLPALWAGDRGRRTGDLLASVDGGGGVIAHGPSWRLAPGRYRLDVVADSPTPQPVGSGAEIVAIVQVLLDGSPVAESELALDQVAVGSARSSGCTLEFEVGARKAPPPLLELTPITDMVFVATGATPIRFHAAVVSRVGDVE